MKNNELELTNFLSDKIFSIRSDRIITIVSKNFTQQIVLPKFIKKNNLDNKKNELKTALSEAIQAEEICITIDVVSKTNNKIAGLYVNDKKCEYISAEDMKRCCETTNHDEIEYIDCEGLF